MLILFSEEKDLYVDILDCGILPKILSFLSSTNLQLQLPSLRIIAGMSGNGQYIQVLQPK